MSRYYPNSKIVKYLRTNIFKVSKPAALPLGEWRKWKAKVRKERPIAYFMTETLPAWLQVIPKYSTDKIRNIRYNISNRIVGSHRLDSKLAKGEYHELSKRMMHSLFDTFVDYLEIEEAHSHIAWGDDIKDQHSYAKICPKKLFKQWRCPQAVIDHLQWEMTLIDKNDSANYSPDQAERAQEKMTLYTWWKVFRPNRLDPDDEVGLTKFSKDMGDKYGVRWMTLGLNSTSMLSSTELTTYHELTNQSFLKEKQREDEDIEMTIRLIKISNHLWT